MTTPNIITNETRDLAGQLELTLNGPEQIAATDRLIRHLGQRCALPEIREKYERYNIAGNGIEPYPLDSEGFAQSFDVLTDEQDMYEHWSRYGVVVGRQVVPEQLCADSIVRIKNIVDELSDGKCDMDSPETYGDLPVDENGVPILTRGFFEIYHDDSLAQLRQSVRAYLHHVVLWGRPDLWTTYDRFGVKLPHHTESAALPLHVDQNPKEHSEFKTVQGVLALDDCPAERGTLVTVPGSKTHFTEYLPMSPVRGEYVELDLTSPIAETFSANAQPIPLRRGNIVNWDSRTTHANTANISELTRFMALISTGPSRQNNSEAVAARAEAFRTALGSNVREAMMHASKKPRYTDGEAVRKVRVPERLTKLGKLLYGQERY